MLPRKLYQYCTALATLTPCRAMTLQGTREGPLQSIPLHDMRYTRSRAPAGEVATNLTLYCMKTYLSGVSVV